IASVHYRCNKDTWKSLAKDYDYEAIYRMVDGWRSRAISHVYRQFAEPDVAAAVESDHNILRFRRKSAIFSQNGILTPKPEPKGCGLFALWSPEFAPHLLRRRDPGCAGGVPRQYRGNRSRPGGE